jgi:hypothetical protein
MNDLRPLPGQNYAQPDSQPQPVATRPARPAVARAKPDPRPMRLALGAAGLAALSAIFTGIVLPPRAAVLPPANVDTGPSNATAAPVAVQRPITYIQLQPGQTAPPGARVIDPAAPKPVTVVTTVPAPAQRAVVVKTTQSGTVVP